MWTVSVTAAERGVLQGYLGSRLKLERLKASAVLLSADGGDVGLIARFVDRKPETVGGWLEHWDEVRLASIFTGHAGNVNASLLTRDQREQVAQVLSTPPSPGGLSAGFWTVPKVADLLQAQFGVVYESDTSYHFLLRFAGLTFKYPQAFDRRRDDNAIEDRMAQIRAEIAPHLVDQDTVVFASDEVQVSSEAVVRKAWLPKKSKTVIKVNRSVRKQSYIGFLNQTTFECTLHRLQWQQTKTIIPALEALTEANPGKKIVIVWDNASWHRSKELRALLGPGNPFEHIHLIAMPPYAPDHNPIEHVWKDAKESISNLQRLTFELTLTAFEDHVKSRTFEYRI